MSTVVGTCTDCIISVPVQPRTSLVFDIVVSEGQNMVIRERGAFRGYYPADNLTTQQMDIAPGSSYTLNSVTALCIQTSQPLQVTVTTAGGGSSFTWTVNSVFIVDQAFDSVAVANPSAATETAYVSLYATLADL